MSQLLEWALENIQEWDEKWTHLRCSPCEVIFTVGNGWCLEGRGQSAEWVWGWLDDGVFTEWVCLTTSTSMSPETITRQQWLDAKGGGSSNDENITPKLSLEELLGPLGEDWTDNFMYELCYRLSLESGRLDNSMVGVRLQLTKYVKEYLQETFTHNSPEYLKKIIAEEEREFKERLEEKKARLRELEGK